jgi:hypothetical protein
MATNKNTKAAVEEQAKLGYELPADIAAEVAGFKDEQLRFPPYWTADVGKKFYAMMVDVDTRDPEFHRFVLQALHSLPCATGGKNAREDVVVENGDFFSMSVYAALPLDRYVGMKVLVEVTGTQPTGQPQDMYVFKLKISEADKLLLTQERKERVAVAMAAYRENKKLQAANGGKPVVQGAIENKASATGAAPAPF